MTRHLIVSLRMTLALLVLTCGVYPAVVWTVAQTAFPHQANGSMLVRDGKTIGSELIGQEFADPRFFHPRPSSSNYDPSASGGTNLGMTSKKLLDTLASRTRDYADAKPPGGIPADAVTASCSGVDPHISPANAASQAPRIAAANHLPLARVEQLIAARTEARFAGVFGEPRVNVLLLNLDLRDAAK